MTYNGSFQLPVKLHKQPTCAMYKYRKFDLAIKKTLFSIYVFGELATPLILYVYQVQGVEQ